MSRWAIAARLNRVVEFGVGQLRGRHTITLAIDAPDGRRGAHLSAREARYVAQRLNDLAFHVEQLDREAA